jgi:hypothetical protein
VQSEHRQAVLNVACADWAAGLPRSPAGYPNLAATARDTAGGGGRFDFLAGWSLMMAGCRAPTGWSNRMTDSAAASADPVMDAILRAVGEGQAGAAGSARGKLLALWSEIGVLGDPLHRCVLAHYLADLYPDPARALAWDVRALDAADAVTEQRAQQLHGNLHIAGFYPSLHLNLADN